MIRVVRLMEYTFDSLEQMEQHFNNCFVPMNGVRLVHNKMEIRSTTLMTPLGRVVDEGLTPIDLEKR